MDIQERLYSVVMTEEEVALYSEFIETLYSDKDDKLARQRKENEYLGDRKEELEYTHGKKPRHEVFADRSKSDEDYEEFYNTGKLRTRRKVKNAAKLGIPLGIYGGVTGYLRGRNIKSTAIGAAVGTAAGAGVSYGIDKLGEHFAKKRLARDPHFYDVDKEYLKYKHGHSTKNKVEKKIREEFKRNNE